MAIFSWLWSKKEPENYETVLESLRLSIQSRQTRLAEIRLRERRTTLLLTLYAFAAWGVYVAVWYMGLVGGRRPDATHLEKLAKGLPVLLGPFLILFIRRIVQAWYTRIGNQEEETLKKLMLEQRNKIEEIKKKTDYYSTLKLLERYDRPDPNSPQAKVLSAGTPVKKQPVPPSNPPFVTPQKPFAGSQNGKQPLPAAAVGTNNYPLQTPPRRQWYDRLADAVLGPEDDDNPQVTKNVNTAINRFALICKKCFQHNGLVREKDLDDMQFVCMKCGTFNPSQRTMRILQSPKSPNNQDQSFVTAVDSNDLGSPRQIEAMLDQEDNRPEERRDNTHVKMEVDG